VVILKAFSRSGGMLGAFGLVTWPALVQEARQKATMAELPAVFGRKSFKNVECGVEASEPYRLRLNSRVSDSYNRCA
jgi:hypothetical protein